MTAWSAARVQAELDRLGRLRFAFLSLLVCLSLAWLAGGLLNSWWWHPPGFVNAGGANIGRDFVALWTAASLALGGEPAAGYDPALLHAAELTTIGAPVGLITWHYPPSFLMLVLPLALLPYPAAAALWVAGTFGAFAKLFQRVAAFPLTWFAALIFPEAPAVHPKSGPPYPSVTGVFLKADKSQWLLINLSAKPVTLRYPGMGSGTIESLRAPSLGTKVTSEHVLTHSTQPFDGRSFVLPPFSVNRVVGH